ncbi:hypothetical protein KEM54_002022, partial [Ascosphaera aggregata]
MATHRTDTILPDIASSQDEEDDLLLLPCPTLWGNDEAMIRSNAQRTDYDSLIRSPGFLVQYLMQFSEPNIEWKLAYDELYIGRVKTEYGESEMRFSKNYPEILFGRLADHPKEVEALLFPQQERPDMPVPRIEVSGPNLPKGFSLPPPPFLKLVPRWRDPTLEDALFTEAFFSEIYRAHGALRTVRDRRAKAVAITASLITERLWPVFEYPDKYPAFVRTRRFSFDLLGWQVLWNLIRKELAVLDYPVTEFDARSQWETEEYPLAVTLLDVFGTIEGFSDHELELLQCCLFERRPNPEDSLRAVGLLHVAESGEELIKRLFPNETRKRINKILDPNAPDGAGVKAAKAPVQHPVLVSHSFTLKRQRLEHGEYTERYSDEYNPNEISDYRAPNGADIPPHYVTPPTSHSPNLSSQHPREGHNNHERSNLRFNITCKRRRLEPVGNTDDNDSNDLIPRAGSQSNLPSPDTSHWSDLSSTFPEEGLANYGRSNQWLKITFKENQLERTPLTETNLNNLDTYDNGEPTLRAVGLDGFDEHIDSWLQTLPPMTAE